MPHGQEKNKDRCPTYVRLISPEDLGSWSQLVHVGASFFFCCSISRAVVYVLIEGDIVRSPVAFSQDVSLVPTLHIPG